MSRRPDLGYFDEGLDLADPETYAAARGALGSATVLPPVAFRSNTFAYLEDEAVWTRAWVALGTLAEIPEEGDLLPFTVGYHGIHVQREPDGALAGRFNKAQHGGCRMVPAQCQVGVKTKCSFTSCGYSRDRGAISMAKEGDNLPTMHQYLGLRPERLFPVAVATVGQVVFANLDPDCSAKELDNLSLPDALTSPEATHVHGEWLEFTANWKLAGQALAAGMPAGSEDHTLMASRTTEDGREILAQWIYPNAVVLAAGEEACLVVVQQTAIEKTMFRMQVFSTTGTADVAFWTAEVERAGRAAEALQRDARGDPGSEAARAAPKIGLQTDHAGLWGQTMLIDRVAAMPREDSAIPMYQGTRQYMI